MQSANKNPPWARSGDNMNMSGMGAGVMQYGAGVGNAAMYGQGMMQNQASMMGMQGGMAMGQMAAGMYPGNVVAYPTPRGAFGNQAQPATAEQRVFTGTVTKTHNDFGFIDHDVFYQTSVCVKGSLPKVNDRVLVEATYNASMPFKWNATRVQVLTNKQSGGYNAVAPPSGERDERRSVRRSPARNRNQAKRARSRTRSPPRQVKRRDSPPRKRAPRRSPTPPKYVVRVPRIPLDVSELDVTTVGQRYTNLYVPSDFFACTVKWSEAFPPQRPFALYNPCQFHILPKEVLSPIQNDAVLEPPDADYRFSAKVMLISLPTLESLYKKCGLIRSDSKERRDSKSALHPTRLIKFLVGQKGKGGDNFAIGGPWSPSLDGENPESDPSVLVRTAIRTTKALTGIDLTPCTQWFRMVEFYYWREDSARLETVVLFLPDVWSTMPSRVDWDSVQALYKKALDARLHPESVQEQKPEDDTVQADEDKEEEAKAEPTHHSKLDLKGIKVEQLREELEARGLPTRGPRAQLLARLSKAVKAEAAAEKDGQAVNGESDNAMDTTMDTSTDMAATTTEEEVVELPEENKPAEEETKEQALLREAYTLPDTPHMIVHPSATAKGGKFNCSTATLSLLLDYRLSDNKEHSFEIFVFAELFNEMLMRDFGFYIFRTLSALPEREPPQEEKDKEKKEGEKDKEKKEGEKEVEDKKSEKKAEIKDSNKADVKDKEKEEDKDKVESKEKQKEGSKDKDDKKDKGKDDRRDRRDRSRDRRRERSAESERCGRGVDLPADPYLLLSLAYFDTYRCNYVLKRDLTALFTALGLRLSRSQLRHVLDKVCSTKDTFIYKPLASAVRDLTGAAAAGLTEPDEVTDAVIKELAIGNRNLLPVFGAKKTDGVPNDNVVGDNGMVTWQGRLVDIGASLAALDRSERRANRLEAALDETREELHTTRSVLQQHSATIANLQQQIDAGCEELAATKKRLTAVTASSKLFQATLKTIKTQVEVVSNISIDGEEPAQAVNGPKCESEAKTEKEEVKTETDTKKPEPETSDKEKEEAVKKEPIADKVEPVSMDLDDK